MEDYYLLSAFKSKGLVHIINTNRKSGALNEKELRNSLESFKDLLTIPSLISNKFDFTIKESDKMLISEKSLEILILKIKLFFKDFDLDKVVSELDRFSVKNATPIRFNDFQDFKDYKNNLKNELPEDKKLSDYINEKKKIERKASKQKAVKERAERKKIRSNEIIEKVTKDSIFVSIDFECLYTDNKIPIEVGLSIFKANESLEKMHFFFKENEDEFKKQHRKFNKTDSFAFGETLSLSNDEIKEKINNVFSRVDVVVCHAAKLEKQILTLLGIDYKGKDMIDSQLLYKSKKGEKQVRSLEGIAKEYDIKDISYHNAGNDAVVTGLYFCELIREQKPELFEVPIIEKKNKMRRVV